VSGGPDGGGVGGGGGGCEGEGPDSRSPLLEKVDYPCGKGSSKFRKRLLRCASHAARLLWRPGKILGFGTSPFCPVKKSWLAGHAGQVPSRGSGGSREPHGRRASRRREKKRAKVGRAELRRKRFCHGKKWGWRKGGFAPGERQAFASPGKNELRRMVRSPSKKMGGKRKKRERQPISCARVGVSYFT